MSQTDSAAAVRRTVAAPMWPVLAVIACGGAVGSLCRYGIQVAAPHRPDEFPWATFGINVSGCLLIGILLVLIGEVWPSQRLLRPFLGVGFLGGYTTFSAYAVDIQRAVEAEAFAVAVLYLATTVVGALLAVWAGVMVTTVAMRARRRAGTTDGGSR
jgi:CrcB protein